MKGSRRWTGDSFLDVCHGDPDRSVPSRLPMGVGLSWHLLEVRRIAPHWSSLWGLVRPMSSMALLPSRGLIWGWNRSTARIVASMKEEGWYNHGLLSLSSCWFVQYLDLTYIRRYCRVPFFFPSCPYQPILFFHPSQ